MSIRATSETERNGLKTAVKRLIVMLGGLDAAATSTRVQRSNLSEYGAVQLADRHMPIDVVLDLERLAGEPLITEALARAQGFALMPLSVGEGDIADALARVSVDAGKTLADAMQAIRDGMPESERLQLVTDLTELTRAANVALGLLQRHPPRPIALAG
jgi:hypothetical protein